MKLSDTSLSSMQMYSPESRHLWRSFLLCNAPLSAHAHSVYCAHGLQASRRDFVKTDPWCPTFQQTGFLPALDLLLQLGVILISNECP